MRDLFGDVRFRLLFAAQLLSMLADSVLLIVLSIWMKELTGSNSLAGVVILAVAAPALLAPLLGWRIDRIRRRPFLISVNILSAFALLPLLAVRGRVDIWIIFTVAAAYGLSLVLNVAGLAGLIKEVVVEERLPEANGSLRTVREGLRLVVPLGGAGLYAVAGPRVVVLVAVVAFLVAAGTLSAMRLQEERALATPGHWRSEIPAGFRHLFSDPPLRRTALALGAGFLVFGAIQSAVFAYVDHGLGRPATFVAVLMTIMGIGSVAGGLLAPWVIRRLGAPGTVAAGLASLALGLAGLVHPAVALALSGVPLAGLGVSFVAVAFATLMQKRTPAALMARVSTVTDLVVGVPQVVSIAIGAVLVSIVDYRWIFLTSALGLLTIAVLLWLRREEPAVPARTVPTGLTSIDPRRQEAPGLRSTTS